MVIADTKKRTIRTLEISKVCRKSKKGYVICLREKPTKEEGSSAIAVKITLSSEEIGILHDAQICAEYPEKGKKS